MQGIDAGLRRRDIGTRLIESGLIIARVDPRKDLTGANSLIVIDRYRGDIAGYPGADQDRMRLHISIVGRHQKAAGCPVIMAVEGCRQRETPARSPSLKSRFNVHRRGSGLRRRLVDGLAIADGLRSMIQRHRHQALCFARPRDGGFATRLRTLRHHAMAARRAVMEEICELGGYARHYTWVGRSAA